MKALPSQSLLDSLAELQLAQPDEVARVASRARRLARDLASFDLAWIDALQQAKLLTPWQAEQLQHGRAGQMSIGRFVLYAPLASLGWATVYRGRCRDTGEWRQIYVADIDAAQQEPVEAGLRQLVESSRRLDGRYCLPVLEAGVEQSDVAGRMRVWGATVDLAARRAQGWLAANGRFAPDIALEIARQTAAAVAHLQTHDHLHGDWATMNLLIDLEGDVRLAVPGLRLVLRRCEGFSRADLPPECYDTLAPERIEPSGPATWESEAYSLAACWWQLLTGRAPFAGGDSLTKLRNLHRARWLDIASYAPETDPRLISSIKQRTAIEPSERPADFHALCQALGESTPLGRRSLGQAMRPAPTPFRWRRQRPSRLPRRGESFPWSTAVVVLLAVLA
ncbi:MAG: protein kinase, partial [Pirellulales bacterium]